MTIFRSPTFRRLSPVAISMDTCSYAYVNPHKIVSSNDVRSLLAVPIFATSNREIVPLCSPKQMYASAACSRPKFEMGSENGEIGTRFLIRFNSYCCETIVCPRQTLVRITPLGRLFSTPLSPLLIFLFFVSGFGGFAFGTRFVGKNRFQPTRGKNSSPLYKNFLPLHGEMILAI